MDLNGKVALITGAAGGIGRATALALAEAGIGALALGDLDETGLMETAARAGTQGCRTYRGRLDVTDPASLQAFFEAAESELGGLDVVINNAGVISGAPHWPETPLEKIRTTLSVNLLGPVYGTRLAIDFLGRRGGGAVVNMASIAAFTPMTNEPMYSSSKLGVVNFTQACAPLAESHAIRVNAVLPGVTETAILGKTGDGNEPAPWLKPALEGAVMLRPEDIAAAVLETLGDDSRAGECLVVVNPSAPGESCRFERLRDAHAFLRHAADANPSS